MTAYSQNKTIHSHIDTSLYLGYNCMQLIDIDSVDFLHIDLVFTCEDESNTYDKDSINNNQNRLVDRLKLTHIDTLVIEYFSENFNVFDLLNQLENVKIVRLISGGSIELTPTEKMVSEKAKKIESLELYARSLKIDLRALDFWEIKNLWIDVEQEEKGKHILFSFESKNIENVYLADYFPKRKKFCKKNQGRFEHSNVFSVDHSFDIPSKNMGEWPSVK